MLVQAQSSAGEEQPYRALADCLAALTPGMYTTPTIRDQALYSVNRQMTDDPDAGVAFLTEGEWIFFINRYEIREQNASGLRNPLRRIDRSQMNVLKSTDFFQFTVKEKFMYLPGNLEAYSPLTLRGVKELKDGICACKSNKISVERINEAIDEIFKKKLRVHDKSEIRSLKKEDLECPLAAV